MSFDSAFDAARRLRPGANWQKHGMGGYALARGAYYGVEIGVYREPGDGNGFRWFAMLTDRYGEHVYDDLGHATTLEALLRMITGPLAARERNLAELRARLLDEGSAP